MLTGVRKGSGSVDPGAEASRFCHIQETGWCDPVGDGCVSPVSKNGEKDDQGHYRLIGLALFLGTKKIFLSWKCLRRHFWTYEGESGWK